MVTNKKEYIVSVRLMTYNHSNFIEQAMGSIMMQKTNFLVEVVVGDDMSTDDTLKKIRKYKNTKNIHINILDRKIGDQYWKKRQKLGRMYNFTNIIENCKGNYIALLDGDDYWIDPNKLQKQVDFLEEHPKFVLHCTNFYSKNDINGELTFNEKYYPQYDIISATDFFKMKYIPQTCSVIFRNKLQNYQQHLIKAEIGDITLFSILINYGLFKYTDDITCVYRNHISGIWNSKTINEKYKAELQTMKIIYRNQNVQNKDLLASTVADKYIRNMRYYKKNRSLFYYLTTIIAFFMFVIVNHRFELLHDKRIIRKLRLNNGK